MNTAINIVAGTALTLGFVVLCGIAVSLILGTPVPFSRRKR